jgi:acylphosphatase
MRIADRIKIYLGAQAVMARKHYNIRVRGKVQGVFYRASARSHALALEVNGFAQNQHDGSVYIEAEGAEENLKQFVEWCRRGPDRALVTEVLVEEGPLNHFTSFEVNRGTYH